MAGLEEKLNHRIRRVLAAGILAHPLLMLLKLVLAYYLIRPPAPIPMDIPSARDPMRGTYVLPMCRLEALS
jgi:hypothetical protein